MWWLAASCILLLLAGHASAYEEADGPTLDPQVERIWHTPDVPAPGQQWQGGIAFQPGHNVTEVLYQVCNVGVACIAPPTAAIAVNDTTWTYDTDDYRDPISDEPVPWGDAALSNGEDWRVGTQFFLRYEGSDDLHAFPHGENLAGDGCRNRYQECSESHYFAWDLPAGELGGAQEAPGLGVVAVLVAAVLALYPMRNRHERS